MEVSEYVATQIGQFAKMKCAQRNEAFAEMVWMLAVLLDDASLVTGESFANNEKRYREIAIARLQESSKK